MKKIFPFLFTYCLLPLLPSLLGEGLGVRCFSQGVWTQKADFGGGVRCAAVGFSIGNKGYIGTGSCKGLFSDSLLRDFWEWDQIANVWTQKADFGGTERFGAVGFSIGTKGYISTGYQASGYTKDFWEWDQATNIWTQKTIFGGGFRDNACCFSINTKAYIGTGAMGSCKNDLWEWDQSTNVWTQKANLPGVARESAVSFSIGTKGYIGTGYDGLGNFEWDFWEWDQATNIWAQKASFGGLVRAGGVGFSIGTKGYIGIGGVVGLHHYDVWEWDQNTNTWTQKANFAGTAGGGAVGFSIGTKGYIGTGSDSTNIFQKDFWEFDPNANGVNEIDLENLISVYPNPSSGTLEIKNDKLKIKNVEVYNIQGEKVYSKEAVNFQIGSSSNFQIDLSTQPNGVYFIHLSTNRGNVTKRIILSH